MNRLVRPPYPIDDLVELLMTIKDCAEVLLSTTDVSRIARVMLVHEACPALGEDWADFLNNYVPFNCSVILDVLDGVADPGVSELTASLPDCRPVANNGAPPDVRRSKP